MYPRRPNSLNFPRTDPDGLMGLKHQVFSQLRIWSYTTVGARTREHSRNHRAYTPVVIGLPLRRGGDDPILIFRRFRGPRRAKASKSFIRLSRGNSHPRPIDGALVSPRSYHSYAYSHRRARSHWSTTTTTSRAIRAPPDERTNPEVAGPVRETTGVSVGVINPFRAWAGYRGCRSRDVYDTRRDLRVLENASGRCRVDRCRR